MVEYIMPKLWKHRDDKQHIQEKNKLEQLEKAGKLKKIEEKSQYYIVEANPEDVADLLRDGLLINNSKLDLATIPSYYPSEYSEIGVKNFWDQQITGVGVNVAIIDTGINHIPCLSGKIIFEKDYTDEASNPSLANRDTRNYNNIQYGHGTQCAAIIAGSSTNYNGIAPDVKIINLKVYNAAGTTSWNHVMSALDDILNDRIPHKVDVVCVSATGNEGTSSFLREWMDITLFKPLREKGIVIVTASGNDGVEIIKGVREQVPALCDVVTVGAINANGYKASFSNYGVDVDFSARGDAVFTYDSRNEPVYFSGTSASTPIVTALYALYLSRNIKPKNAAELDTITNFIKNNGSVISGVEGNKMGKLPKSVTTLIFPPPNVTNLRVDNITQNSLKLNWNAAVNALSYDIYNGTILLGNTTDIYFNVANLKSNTSYTFKIVAKNAYGESLGQTINVTTAQDTTPPAEVTNLTATVISGNIQLNWIASASSDIKEYQIFKDGSLIATVTNISYLATGLTQNQSYTFIVKSVDSSGNVSTGLSITKYVSPQLYPPDDFGYGFPGGYLVISIILSYDNPHLTEYEVKLYNYDTREFMETLFFDHASPGEEISFNPQLDESMNYQVIVRATYNGYPTRYDSFNIISS